MSVDAKQRTADLSALVGQFERKELHIIQVILKAYSMGHDDATDAWNRSNEVLAKALNVTLPKVKR